MTEWLPGLVHTGKGVWMRPWTTRLDCWTTWLCLCNLALVAMVAAGPWLIWYSLSSNADGMSATLSLERACNTTTVSVPSRRTGRAYSSQESRSTCVPLRGDCPALCQLGDGCGALGRNVTVVGAQHGSGGTPWVTPARVAMCDSTDPWIIAVWAVAFVAAVGLARNAHRVHVLSTYIEWQHMHPPEANESDTVTWWAVSACGLPCLRGVCGDDLTGPAWSGARAVACTVAAGAVAAACLAVVVWKMMVGRVATEAWLGELCGAVMAVPANAEADAEHWRHLLCVPPVQVVVGSGVGVTAAAAGLAVVQGVAAVAVLCRLAGEWRRVPRRNVGSLPWEWKGTGAQAGW